MIENFSEELTNSLLNNEIINDNVARAIQGDNSKITLLYHPNRVLVVIGGIHLDKIYPIETLYQAFNSGRVSNVNLISIQRFSNRLVDYRIYTKLLKSEYSDSYSFMPKVLKLFKNFKPSLYLDLPYEGQLAFGYLSEPYLDIPKFGLDSINMFLYRLLDYVSLDGFIRFPYKDGENLVISRKEGTINFNLTSSKAEEEKKPEPYFINTSYSSNNDRVDTQRSYQNSEDISDSKRVSISEEHYLSKAKEIFKEFCSKNNTDELYKKYKDKVFYPLKDVEGVTKQENDYFGYRYFFSLGEGFSDIVDISEIDLYLVSHKINILSGVVDTISIDDVDIDYKYLRSILLKADLDAILYPQNKGVGVHKRLGDYSVSIKSITLTCSDFAINNLRRIIKVQSSRNMMGSFYVEAFELLLKDSKKFEEVYLSNLKNYYSFYINLYKTYKSLASGDRKSLFSVLNYSTLSSLNSDDLNKYNNQQKGYKENYKKEIKSIRRSARGTGVKI